MNLSVKRYLTIDEARSAWLAVLEADACSSFFSSPTWLETWWQHHHLGRELLLLGVFSGATAVGFAPLMVKPIPGGRAVLFLGSGLSDYADILADEGLIPRADVVRAVLSHLADSFPGALFDLQQIPRSSPNLPLIEEWLVGVRVRRTIAPQDVCPIIALPETAEEYHRQLRKSFLADVRRGERRLRERGVVDLVDHIAPDAGDWTSLRDQMSDLQSQRMRTKGEVPLWQGPLGAFVKDVLAAADAAGKLRLTGLYLDGKMIAYELCFLHGRVIYAWSRAFDEEYRNTGPGKIALLHLLEKGIAEGFRVFDLLRGEEPYKELWTNGLIQNMRVTFVVRPSLGALVMYKYLTSWKARLRQNPLVGRLRRALKSLRRGG